MSKRVGLYLGENFVSSVVLEGRRIISFFKMNLSHLRKSDEQNLDEVTLWELAISKSLKEVKAEGGVFVSLADKDFIFRIFQLPRMNKKEIASALTYGMADSLPFKIEELMCDYRYITNHKLKKLEVSFLGIKTSLYNKYKDIFFNMDINVLNIEPSAISLVRLVKLMPAMREAKNFALLDVSNEEAYITFFYKDLPVFNRYLKMLEDKSKDGTDKLLEEVRISLRYFQREFRWQSLDTLVIICDSNLKDILSSLKDMEMEILLFTPLDIVNRDDINVSHLKAYGVALSGKLPYNFNPKLKEIKPQPTSFPKTTFDLSSLNFKLIGIISVLGILFCFGLNAFLGNLLFNKEVDLKRKEESLQLPEFIKNSSLEEINSFYQEKERKLLSLKNRFAQIVRISPFLQRLPSILTEGLWLDTIDFKLLEGKANLSISGYVFLINPAKEKMSFDKFVSNLRGSEEFKKIFSQIELKSTERIDMRGRNVLRFLINLY
ncbi:MAG: PilN domain-containing protein [Candidatus Omnitrophica bacterium]|nr:PilN domain-containing protein [Candidatus Omnitrophota bacterium]